MSALGMVAVNRSVQDAQCPPPEKVLVLGGSPHSVSVACAIPVFWSSPKFEFAVAQGRPPHHTDTGWKQLIG